MRAPLSSLLLFAVALAVAGAARADHTAIGPQDPTGEEQAGIWELNRARANPTAFGQEIGVDLSTVDPQPPLAVNRHLTGSARFHAQEMLDHDYFSHTSQVTGDGPNQMAVDHGYDVFGVGLGVDRGTANSIESNAFGFNRIPTFVPVIALLIEDAGVSSLGHRIHLLAMHSQYETHREIGCGRAASGKTRLYSIHTANEGPSTLFLTGVVYRDANGNQRFDADEGLGGVTITDGEGGQTTTMPSGGWSLPTGNGTYTVTATGGAFGGPVAAPVTVNGANVEVDFIAGLAVAEIGFAFRENGFPDGSEVGVTVNPTSGPAPLMVTGAGFTDGDGAVFSWDWGDGNNGTGEEAGNTYGTPGLYPVVVSSADSLGGGSALALVAVSGEDGGGEGTTDPASDALVVTKAVLKANFKVEGRDKAIFKGALELPAGFVAEGTDCEVVVAGVKRTFTLDAKGKGADEGGNKVIIKFKRPKGDVALPAGTTAKVIVKLKGDLRDALVAAGLRNRDEVRTVPTVPFGVLLHEFPWTATRPVAAKAKKGKKASGKTVAE